MPAGPCPIGGANCPIYIYMISRFTQQLQADLWTHERPLWRADGRGVYIAGVRH